MRLGHWLLALILLGFHWQAHAAFITDQLEVDIHAQAQGAGIKLGSIQAGDSVQVIASDGEYARVRTASNITGWIEAKYLSDETPTITLLKNAQAKIRALEIELHGAREQQASDQAISAVELEKLRKEAKETGWMRAELKKTRARVKQLENSLQDNSQTSQDAAQQLSELRRQNSELEQRLGAVLLVNGQHDSQLIDSTPAADAEISDENGFLHRLAALTKQGGPLLKLEWFLGSIVLAVIIGFVIGFSWLDKRIRRRHGGFRLY